MARGLTLIQALIAADLELQRKSALKSAFISAPFFVKPSANVARIGDE
jgi:hypothetical protein